jgi:dTDP-4-dehydrorhamnose reductase
VTGGTGLLGTRVVPCLREAGFDVMSHGLRDEADVRADLLSRDDTRLMLDSIRPKAVVHLVGATSVDRCEADPDWAYGINVLTLHHVVDWIQESGDSQLIYMSTDHMYDGIGKNSEEDVNLRNVYALTKLWAESAAARVDGTIIRSNFFGRSHSSGRASFTDWVRKAAERPCDVTLMTDVVFSPLSMETLSGVIRDLLRLAIPGVFNAGSQDSMSKRDFALMIAERMGLSLDGSKDGTLQDLTLGARRPTGMAMNSRRLEAKLGSRFLTLREELDSAEI